MQAAARFPRPQGGAPLDRVPASVPRESLQRRRVIAFLQPQRRHRQLPEPSVEFGGCGFPRRFRRGFPLFRRAFRDGRFHLRLETGKLERQPVDSFAPGPLGIDPCRLPYDLSFQGRHLRLHSPRRDETSDPRKCIWATMNPNIAVRTAPETASRIVVPAQFALPDLSPEPWAARWQSRGTPP